MNYNTVRNKSKSVRYRTLPTLTLPKCERRLLPHFPYSPTPVLPPFPYSTDPYSCSPSPTSVNPYTPTSA